MEAKDPQDVFFYGLFMDVDLLRSKGAHPERPRVGWVEDTRLAIGARAALVPEPGSRAYGVVISLPEEEVQALYADESVSDYAPGPVEVTLAAAHRQRLATTCRTTKPPSRISTTRRGCETWPGGWAYRTSTSLPSRWSAVSPARSKGPPRL